MAPILDSDLTYFHQEVGKTGKFVRGIGPKGNEVIAYDKHSLEHQEIANDNGVKEVHDAGSLTLGSEKAYVRGRSTEYHDKQRLPLTEELRKETADLVKIVTGIPTKGMLR